MTLSPGGRIGAVGRCAKQVAERAGELEVLDRSYTLAAQTFVAMIPLILVITALIAGADSDSLVADELIERFGLVGAAARTMRELIVVQREGVYLLGAVVTLYSAFVLARRTSRTYNMIWRTPMLAPAQQWRSLLWILIQVLMVAAVTQLRDVARESGAGAGVLLALVVLLLWGASDYLCQWLFTQGAVARRRLVTAAVLVCIGRIGMVVWSSAYLSSSLAKQAVAYGPIGVVFSLFSGLFVMWMVLLGATLVAAALTEPAPPDGAEEGRRGSPSLI